MLYSVEFVAVPSAVNHIKEISIVEVHNDLDHDAVLRTLDEAMDEGMDLVVDIADVYVGTDRLLVSSISLNQYGDAYLAKCVCEAVESLEESA